MDIRIASCDIERIDYRTDDSQFANLHLTLKGNRIGINVNGADYVVERSGINTIIRPATEIDYAERK